MPRLRTLRRLGRTEWTLLARALATVWLVRMGLWLLPFRLLRRWVGRVKQAVRGDTAHVSPAVIAWSVAVASRYVPGATCLTQAMATETLLKRFGHQGVLRIGVAPGEAGNIEAHAWLECQGKIIIGGEGHRRFVPMQPMEREKR